MKISTKGRYALRLMLDIALQPEDKPVILKDVSARQDISLKYLEQIMPSLTGAGVVRSVRGPKGGYYLNKKASDISMGQILRITEGSLAPLPCVDPDIGRASCNRSDDCVTIDVWQKMYDAITDVVDNVSLQDLVDKSRAKGGEYYI